MNSVKPFLLGIHQYQGDPGSISFTWGELTVIRVGLHVGVDHSDGLRDIPHVDEVVVILLIMVCLSDGKQVVQGFPPVLPLAELSFPMS